MDNKEKYKHLNVDFTDTKRTDTISPTVIIIKPDKMANTIELIKAWIKYKLKKSFTWIIFCKKLARTYNIGEKKKIENAMIVNPSINKMNLFLWNKYS